MQSEVSEISPVLVEVRVQVPWERVQKGLDQEFNRIAKTARIKGFRPGKAPRNVVRQLFSKQVKGDVTATLVEEGLLHAVEEHELQIVAQPSIDPLDELAEGTPLTFTAKVEVRPKVESVQLDDLVLYRPTEAVSDKEVDEELERLRAQHAELHVPDPMRPAQDGDQLVVEYTVEIDGSPRPDMSATDRPIELGADRLLPEFEEGLKGVQPGEARTVNVTFADDHGSKDLRGKSATFEVNVKELRTKILPELDDEFAKDLGEHETLDELRTAIRERLEQEGARKTEAALKEQAIDRLVEKNPVPVPPSMVRQQESMMMYEFASFLQLTGQDVPLSEELHSNMHSRAERRVRAALVLGALARQEGFSVEDAEYEKKLEEIATGSGKHIAKVRVDYAGERGDELRNQLLEQKLMDFLLSKAQIKEGPPPSAAESVSSEASPEEPGALPKAKSEENT